jgi:hypothetical protein
MSDEKRPLPVDIVTSQVEHGQGRVALEHLTYSQSPLIAQAIPAQV